MNNHNKLKLSVFIIVFLTIFGYFVTVFSGTPTMNADRISGFYVEPKNSLDVIYVGSSSVHAFWAAPLVWQEYGITSYSLSTDAQPLSAVKYLIEESLKTQSPELFIVYVGNAVTDKNASKMGIRNVTDNMKYSVNRFKAIYNILRAEILNHDEELDFDEKLDYYFGFFKYHGRWEDGIKKEQWVRTNHNLKGTHFLARHTYTIKPIDRYDPDTDEKLQIDPKQEKVLRDLLGYCKQKDLPVLFVNAPFSIDKEFCMKTNYVASIVSDYGYKFIDFNRLYDEIGLDFSSDFYNTTHTNLMGQMKFTFYLADYLVDNYVFSDKRDKEGYESWDEAAEYYESIRIEFMKRLALQ